MRSALRWRRRRPPVPAHKPPDPVLPPRGDPADRLVVEEALDVAGKGIGSLYGGRRSLLQRPHQHPVEGSPRTVRASLRISVERRRAAISAAVSPNWLNCVLGFGRVLRDHPQRGVEGSSGGSVWREWRHLCHHSYKTTPSE
jgi:hypothetical protein